MQSFVLYCLSVSLMLAISWPQLSRTAPAALKQIAAAAATQQNTDWENPIIVDILPNGLRTGLNFELPFFALHSSRTLTLGKSPSNNDEVVSNYRRKRHALNGLEQVAPCYTMGAGSGGAAGGAQVDYDEIAERRKNARKRKAANNIGAKVRSAMNKLKNKKFVAGGESDIVQLRRRRQVEQENMPKDIAAKVKEYMEHVQRAWTSFVNSMREFSHNISEKFKAQNESAVK